MKATIPAWVKDDYLNLSQVLARIGDNECLWLLDDFEGVTLPSSDLSASQLEQRNRDGRSVEFRWESLVGFAGHVHQMVNGRLSAQATGNPDEDVVLTLEAFDSSEWIIEARDDNAWALEALLRHHHGHALSPAHQRTHLGTSAYLSAADIRTLAQGSRQVTWVCHLSESALGTA